MGSSAMDSLHEPPQKPPSSSSTSSFVRRRSNQSSASTVMTEAGDTSTTASVVTVSQPSTPANEHSQLSTDSSLFGSSLPPSLESSWMRSMSGIVPSRGSHQPLVADIAGSAPSSSSIMASNKSISRALDQPMNHPTSGPTTQSHDVPSSNHLTTTTVPLREEPTRARNALPSRSNQSGRNLTGVPHTRGPMSSTTSSAVDRRLMDKYERVNQEIERVIRATNADVTPDNGHLLKQVRAELRKAKKNSTQIIQSQKALLEKMERHERGGFRRRFVLNREHKMDKLRTKLCEKLNQSVAADAQLDRLARQSVSLTRTSLASLCGTSMGGCLEHDELVELEREREDIVASLIATAGLTDAQELQSRLALYASEKRACECASKQVDQCESFYRKALHLLRVALSTILAPTYSGSLKEFVLGPYPLAVEASQLIEQACRAIQPESRRRYSAYTPELSTVRPPKFPPQLTDFAKRGARSNFDPSNAAAIEAMRKLHLSENVVILLQRIVIAKLELIDKWKRDVARDAEIAEEGHRKVDARLQEHLARLARSVCAA